MPHAVHDQTRRNGRRRIIDMAGQVAPGRHALMYDRVFGVERGTQHQSRILQGQCACQMLLAVQGDTPDQPAVIELLRHFAEQHARADPHQQRQFVGQTILCQGIQAGQQHVLFHLPEFGRCIGRGGPAAQHQLVRNQTGGGIEQWIERQETCPQDVLSNRIAAGDAEHLRHDYRLFGFAGIDAAADDA